MWQIRRFIFMLSCHLLLVYANDSIESPASSQVANSFNIPACNEKDENLNDCLLKVFNEIIPLSKDGIPEINVPPMDPFVINKTSFVFSHPMIQGKIAVRNVKVHGLSKVTTKRVDYKRKGDQVTVRFNGFIPKMFVEGTYKAKIKINNINIASKGPFNATFTNIDVESESLSDLYKEDGHRYLRLRTFGFDPNVGNMQFNAEGLLPEPLLNDAVVEFLNQNSRTVYRTLIPETRSAWEPEFIKIGNEFLSHIPVDAVLKVD